MKKKFYYGWVMSLALWLIYVVAMGFPLYGGAVINAKLISQGHLTTSILGFATGISPLIQGVMAPVTAWLLRKKNYRFAYFLGLFILLIAFLLLALGGFSYPLFILSFGVLLGIGMGISGNYLVQTTLNSWFHQKKTMALALSLSGGGMAGFFLPPLMNRFLVDGNWRRGWWICAAAVVFGLIIAYFFVKNSPEDVGQKVEDEGQEGGKEQPLVRYLRPRRKDYNLKEALSQSLFYGICFNSFTRYLCYYGILSHLLIHTAKRGLSPGQGSLILSLLSLGNLAGRFIAGFVGENRITPKNSLILSGITMSLAATLLAAPTGNLGLGLGGALTGFSLGYGSLMQAVAVSSSFGNRDFAKIYGSITPVFNLGGALGPMIAGIMASSFGGYSLIFGLFAFFNLLASLLLFFIHPKEI